MQTHRAHEPRANEYMCIGGPWCGEWHGMFDHETTFVVRGTIVNGKQEWGRYYRVPRNYILASTTKPGVYKDVLLWKDESPQSPERVRREENGTSTYGDPE